MGERPRTNDWHICVSVSHRVNLIETSVIPIERNIFSVSKRCERIPCPVQNTVLIYRVVFVPLFGSLVIAPSLIYGRKMQLVKRVPGYLISRAYCVIDTSVLPKFILDGVV